MPVKDNRNQPKVANPSKMPHEGARWLQHVCVEDATTELPSNSKIGHHQCHHHEDTALVL
jgi:hypothetical protein